MNDLNSEKLALWDWFKRTLDFAMQPTTLDLMNDDDDGVPDRMARRMAAILIVDRATAMGMSEGAIEELRQEFRKVHPGIFPQHKHG